jgi:transcriptional pleiotropic regulator of transition state genes
MIDPRGEIIGIVRTVDTLGRIVIPMEIRRTLGITGNSLVEIIPYDNGVLIKPFEEAKRKEQTP